MAHSQVLDQCHGCEQIIEFLWLNRCGQGAVDGSRPGVNAAVDAQRKYSPAPTHQRFCETSRLSVTCELRLQEAGGRALPIIWAALQVWPRRKPRPSRRSGSMAWIWIPRRSEAKFAAFAQSPFWPVPAVPAGHAHGCRRRHAVPLGREAGEGGGSFGACDVVHVEFRFEGSRVPASDTQPAGVSLEGRAPIQASSKKAISFKVLGASPELEDPNLPPERPDFSGMDKAAAPPCGSCADGSR